jgi:transcriptional regulator with XRE-family HTH domain
VGQTETFHNGFLMDFDRQGFYREVGLRLHRLRKGRELTQEQVATALGITRPSYANIERGRQTVALDLIWRASVFFGVPLDRIAPEPLFVAPRLPNDLADFGASGTATWSPAVSRLRAGALTDQQP